MRHQRLHFRPMKTLAVGPVRSSEAKQGREQFHRLTQDRHKPDPRLFYCTHSSLITLLKIALIWPGEQCTFAHSASEQALTSKHHHTAAWQEDDSIDPNNTTALISGRETDEHLSQEPWRVQDGHWQHYLYVPQAEMPERAILSPSR